MSYLLQMELVSKLGFPLEGRSSGVLQQSLRTYMEENSEKGKAVAHVLSQLCMRPMKVPS